MTRKPQKIALFVLILPTYFYLRVKGKKIGFSLFPIKIVMANMKLKVIGLSNTKAVGDLYY